MTRGLSTRAPQRLAVASRVVALAALLNLVAPMGSMAHAIDASPQTVELCSSSTIRCTISVARPVREGTPTMVTLTGRPGATVSVRASRLVLSGGTVTATEPLGDPVEATINAGGAGAARLYLPPQEAESSWILVTTGDVAGTPDLDAVVGSVALYGGRRPQILGDGYTRQKPVGTDIRLRVAGAVAGHRFAVEYRDDHGAWHDITVRPTAFLPQDPSAVETHDVVYRLPAGLPRQPLHLRLVNRTDSMTPRRFVAVPSTQGVPSARTELWRPPRVGSAVAGAGLEPYHDTSRVIRVSAVAGGLAAAGALLLLMGGSARARRGRVVKVIR